MLTHPLITRSIEQAQKRVELQNFQSRKRLLEYDDVMNQQREVIYSLRAFALEGGEELKGEALKMVEKALGRRVETVLAEYETADGVGFRAAAAGAADALHDPARLAESIRSCVRPTLVAAQEQADRGGTRRIRGEDRDAGRDARRRRAATATGCCARDAQRAGREVEGSPLRPRPAAQRDPLPVVGAEGPAASSTSRKRTRCSWT